MQLVIRSAAQLDAALRKAESPADLARELKVKEIDWTKQMLVVVSGGTQRKGGYRVEVTGVEVKDGTMTVRWKITPPKGLATNALTHPAEVVLLPQTTGKVVFDPALTPASPGEIRHDPVARSAALARTTAPTPAA